MSCERSAANVNGTWTTIASLPSSSAYQAAMVTLNGMVYVIGGYSTGPLAQVLMHDGGTPGTWTNKASIPEGRSGHSVLALDNNRALLCGGASGGSALNTCYIYTASTDSWTTTIPSMAHNRHNFGFVMSESMSMTTMNNYVHCRQHLRNRQHIWKWYVNN